MLHRSAKAGAPEPLIEVKKIKTIYKKQCELPPNHQDNFAVSAYENTLAVPDPNIPPIEPIIRDMYCPYQPEEDPTHMIHEDKSCLSKPEVNNTQSRKNEMPTNERQNLVITLVSAEPKSVLYLEYLNS